MQRKENKSSGPLGQWGLGLSSISVAVYRTIIDDEHLDLRMNLFPSYMMRICLLFSLCIHFYSHEFLARITEINTRYLIIKSIVITNKQIK